MATRRIARGRSASPVPVIVLSVIVVGLLGASIIFGLKVGELEDQVKQKEEDIVEARNEQATMHKYILKYSRLVGLDFESAKSEYDEELAKLKQLDKVTPRYTKEGEPREPTVLELFQDYDSYVADLEGKVEDLEQKVTDANTQIEQLRSQLGAKEDNWTAEIEKWKQQAEKFEKEKAAVQEELETTRNNLTAQIEKLKAEKIELSQDVAALEKKVEVKDDSIAQLEQQVEELKLAKTKPWKLVDIPRREPVDGRILHVGGDGQYVTIDLGRNDWVGLGMEFQVYDNTDPETRQVKGRVQVREVKSDIATAKILEQDELDPILPGMVLVNPAFERGKVVEFVLVPPLQERDLERLLRRYRCRVAEEVTSDTDYVILGEGSRADEGLDPLDSEPVRKAESLGVVVMKETTLLRYLGELD